MSEQASDRSKAQLSAGSAEHAVSAPFVGSASANRPLNESQRAMVAAKLATLPRGANQHASTDAPSQAAAAELLNVSRPSVQRAREVLARGTPELVEAVEAGRVSVSAAARELRAKNAERPSSAPPATSSGSVRAAVDQRRDPRWIVAMLRAGVRPDDPRLRGGTSDRTATPGAASDAHDGEER
jgi:hypothetical protein